MSLRSVLGALTGAVLGIGLSLSAQAGPDLPPALFDPAPAGTEQSWRNIDSGETGNSVIGSPNGYRIHWEWEGDERTGMFFCFHCTGRAPAPEDEYAELWPLEVGKSVSFYRRRADRSWKTTITVTGTETVEVENIGPVDVYVVEYKSSAVGRSWKGEAVSYYAPSLGWNVRSHLTDTEGVDNAWELIGDSRF